MELAYFATEFHQIGEVLQTFGHHDEAPGCGRTRLLGDEPELTRVQQGRAQKSQEDEARDYSSAHEALRGPFRDYRPLQARADVADRSRASFG